MALANRRSARPGREVPDIYKPFQGSAWTWIECEPAHARRIISRFVTKSVWFIHEQSEGLVTLIFSSAVDLEKDIRARLPGIEFSVQEDC